MEYFDRSFAVEIGAAAPRKGHYTHSLGVQRKKAVNGVRLRWIPGFARKW